MKKSVNGRQLASNTGNSNTQFATCKLSRLHLPSIGFNLCSLLSVSQRLSGGIVSALVNYWMNRRASRKRDKIRMIEDKIRMYAFVLYYLNELRFKFQIISSRLGKPQEEDGYLYISDKNKDEWKPLVEAIDNKLREQPHLVSPQIHKKWVEVKSLFFDPKSKKAISELRKMLADEGNSIVKKHLKYIDQDVISGFSLDESVIGSTTQYNDNKDKDDRT